MEPNEANTWYRMGQIALASNKCIYLGESPDDLSVYVMPGYEAWIAVWGLLGEWVSSSH